MSVCHCSHTAPLFLSLLLTAAVAGADGQPIALHPENPHYLVYRGNPLVPIGSAEHYGAVLNLDFDYVKYLDELAKHGLTHTRTFTGLYCEPLGAFNIAGNTLAPAPGRLITPWARGDLSGYENGGNRFDLSKWDPAYFGRLKDFVAQAQHRGIIVELVLFCPFYKDEMWELSPMNASNNVNGLGTVGRNDVYTLEKHGGLLAVHEAVTRKVVQELNSYDNLYYEVCNEPYFGGVTEAWERHITDLIVATEKDLPKQHLVSHNIANGSARVDDPHPAAAILNFHYASPPTAVGVNYDLDRVIGLNETGFNGTGDKYYRTEAWQFLLAGGGLYSHLDYSFTPGHENGSFRYPDTQPGGGSEAFRAQMGVLSKFLHGFNLLRMKPANNILNGSLQENGHAYVLAEPGEQYAIYVSTKPSAELALNLPPGNYVARWIDVSDGKLLLRQELRHQRGIARVALPELPTDGALRIVRE